MTTVICRKCGGPHFTIKCGKEKKIEEDKITPSENESVNKQSFSNVKSYEKPARREKYHSKITYRVKLSELPKDMYNEELMELTAEWGHIVKTKIYISFQFTKYFLSQLSIFIKSSSIVMSDLLFFDMFSL